MHVDHVVPGLTPAEVGAYLAVGGPTSSPWPSIAPVAIAIGTSLVLDEFALILQMQDVYWSARAGSRSRWSHWRWRAWAWRCWVPPRSALDDVSKSELAVRRDAHSGRAG